MDTFSVASSLPLPPSPPPRLLAYFYLSPPPPRVGGGGRQIVEDKNREWGDGSEGFSHSAVLPCTAQRSAALGREDINRAGRRWLGKGGWGRREMGDAIARAMKKDNNRQRPHKGPTELSTKHRRSLPPYLPPNNNHRLPPYCSRNQNVPLHEFYDGRIHVGQGENGQLVLLLLEYPSDGRVLAATGADSAGALEPHLAPALPLPMLELLERALVESLGDDAVQMDVTAKGRLR
jgi:hypothetical protein